QLRGGRRCHQHQHARRAQHFLLHTHSSISRGKGLVGQRQRRHIERRNTQRGFIGKRSRLDRIHGKCSRRFDRRKASFMISGGSENVRRGFCDRSTDVRSADGRWH